jgi:hypothetical protein
MGALQFIGSSAPIPGSSVRISDPRQSSLSRAFSFHGQAPAAKLMSSFYSFVGPERRECWFSASRG